MNIASRLGLLVIICSASITATAQQSEPLASLGGGLEVSIIPETIVSIDESIKQVDIVIAREKSADRTSGGTTIAGKMQVNCASKQARMINIKIVKLAPGEEMSELPENSPWLDLQDSPDDVKTHKRMCEPAAASGKQP